MPNNFEKPKKDEMADFHAERGIDPNATPESLDEQRSLWSDIQQRPSSSPENAVDPDLAEEKRAEAARMQEEAEEAKAKTEAEARKKLRESTTIKDAQPRTESAELPRFATTPQEPQGLLARIKGLFQRK